MATKMNRLPLEVNHYYHIFNTGNNDEKLFLQKKHWQFFLNSYAEIVEPGVTTFAYSLLPENFHILLGIEEEYSSNANTNHRFRRFFQQYAIWFNKMEGRKGSLFTKNFKRIEIVGQPALKNIVFNIHRSPVKQGITTDFTNYPYSSFSAFFNSKNSLVATEEVLSWFSNDIWEFKNYHHLEDHQPDLIREVILEKRLALQKPQPMSL